MGVFIPVRSNGLTAPPYVFCLIVIISCAFVSDGAHYRGYLVAGNALISAVGFLHYGHHQRTPLLRHLLLTHLGIGCHDFGMGNQYLWYRQQEGRWPMDSDAIGHCGPLGTSVFRSSDGPYYGKGMWICFAFSFLVCSMASN